MFWFFFRTLLVSLQVLCLMLFIALPIRVGLADLPVVLPLLKDLFSSLPVLVVHLAVPVIVDSWGSEVLTVL